MYKKFGYLIHNVKRENEKKFMGNKMVVHRL